MPLIPLALQAHAESRFADKAFIELCRTGTLQEVTNAIKNRENVNTKTNNGETPLMAAAQHNDNPKVITALVKAGAGVNARDKSGDTPLIFAAANPHTGVITALVKAGADVNVKTNSGGLTPLILAAFSPNPEAITILLEAGADPKARDDSGRMAIDYATENANLENTNALRQLELASR